MVYFFFRRVLLLEIHIAAYIIFMDSPCTHNFHSPCLFPLLTNKTHIQHNIQSTIHISSEEWMDRWMDGSVGRSVWLVWLVALPLCCCCCCRVIVCRFDFVYFPSLLKCELRTANNTCGVCMAEIPENTNNNNSNSDMESAAAASGTNEKTIFDLNRHFHLGLI